ncbi:hypothetical protein F4859DRAFT_529322 [Xylaria cf. heliscus]|nr:hypothetical protein F4859DRAFT_529322 [Xylaria cf. heliscus]
MANRGDMDLARQLQAEFGRAKQPKGKGRRRAGGIDHGNIQAPSEPQSQHRQPPQPRRQSEQTTRDQGKSRRRSRRPSSATYPSCSTRQGKGKLATNDSPSKEPLIVLSILIKTPIQIYRSNGRISLHTTETNLFFHGYQNPLPPSSSSPTVSRATSRLPPNAQQLNGQQSTLNNPYFSQPPHSDGTGAFGMPLHQRTSQVMPKAPRNTTLSAPTVTSQRTEFPHIQQVEEQEDIVMRDADIPLAAAPKPTSTNPPKGLSSSMWNPANEKARAESVDNSQASLKPHSGTCSSAKKVEIVTSGLTKGPGLKASR